MATTMIVFQAALWKAAESDWRQFPSMEGKRSNVDPKKAKRPDKKD